MEWFFQIDSSEAHLYQIEGHLLALEGELRR
jgi:hypothetical protein